MKKFLEVFVAVVLTILALPAVLLISICVGVVVAFKSIAESIDRAL